MEWVNISKQREVLDNGKGKNFLVCCFLSLVLKCYSEKTSLWWEDGEGVLFRMSHKVCNHKVMRTTGLWDEDFYEKLVNQFHELTSSDWGFTFRTWYALFHLIPKTTCEVDCILIILQMWNWSSGTLSCMAIKRWSLGLNPDRSDSKACQLFCYTISLTGMKSSHGELIWNPRSGTFVEHL